MENAQHSYPNALHAWEYLVNQGWKVARGRFYQHRDERKIRPARDGRFHEKDLIKYAKRYLQKKDGSSASEETEQMQQAKVDAETRKLKAQAEHWEIKTKTLAGRFVEKQWFERELAARAAVFRSDIENFFRAEAHGMIGMVGGDPVKAPDLTQFALARAEEWMARYSEGRKFDAEIPVQDDEEVEKDELEEEE